MAVERFDLYIDGRSAPPTGGRYFATIDPATGEAWAEVAVADDSDVERAVKAAKAAFERGPWPALTGVGRAAALRRLGDLVKDNAEMLAVAEVRDNAKSITEMRGQMRNMAEWYYYYGGLADKLEGQVIPAERPELFNYTMYEPLGVVAAILPWNSPLRLAAWKLAPALAAGNTAVVKPSGVTSTSLLIFCRLVEEAGFPKGVVNVVTGPGADVGMALVRHPDVAKIAFTGGERVGTRIYEEAARGLKRVSLELGGKSANIVFEDADLDSAARGAVSGVFGSTGQTCTAGSRLLAQRSIHDALVARVVAMTRGMRLGPPMDEATEICPITTPAQYDTILDYIEIAKAEGAHLACGGRAVPAPDGGKALFIEPTVFTGVGNAMRIAQEEVFGPVLAVIPFDDEDEAVEIANDTHFGLAAGMWTRDAARLHRVARRLQAGTVWANTYRVTSQLSPYGGYKRSGIGREGGAEMIKDYQQVKSVWTNMAPDYRSPFPSVDAYRHPPETAE